MQRRLTMIAAVLIGAAGLVAPAQAQAKAPPQRSPRPVPERVMLQSADLGGALPGPVEDGFGWPLLPQPCADTQVPRPAASRSLAADYGGRFRVYENVGRYRGDGARAYVTELKAQLARCGVGGGDNGFDPIAEDHMGPDMLLFAGNYDEGDRYVGYFVAAAGQYVVVVIMSDSLYGAADLTVLNGLGSAAMSRATA